MASSSASSPEIQPAPTAESSERFSYKHATHEDVLEDLSSRFLLNLPDEELSSLERICFQVEQAHWFYEDFIREENPKFPSLPLKKFSAMLFHACPLLHQWSHDHEQAFNTFMQYKTRVPVCGAIMLNDTWEKCILVKGWKSSSGWGFPKGKINEDEPPHDCAIREVLEETGYNLAGQLDPNDVIQMSIKEQLISLYIVPGVPEDYMFRTRTRKEISRIEWFKLTDLPTWKRNKAAPGKFYLISPFIGALKAFINEHKPQAIHGRGHKHVHSIHSNGLSRPQSFNSRDHSAQESSSQSSSADNGDPQTPSPQYTQATPVTNGYVTKTHESDDEVMYPQEMDPHFARLLNSLSLSAVGPKNVQRKLDATSLQPDTLLPRSKTPVPDIMPFTPAVQSNNSHHSKSADTSAFLLDDSVKVNGLDGAAVGPSKPNLVHRALRSKEAPTIELSRNGVNARSVISPPLPSPSSSSVSTSNTSSSVTPARKPSMSSRRSSSTADISPYLTRPTELPTSGKRLKQLALLESVADESSRLTPVVNNCDLPRINDAYYVGPSNMRHPGPSSSVPPLLSTDMRAMHSLNLSQQGPTLIPGISHPPLSMDVSHPPAMIDDPFQVRPRSSQFTPHGPGYLPQHGPLGMPQSSLHLSLMNGPIAPGASHAHFQQHPFMNFPPHPYAPPVLVNRPHSSANYARPAMSTFHPPPHVGGLPPISAPMHNHLPPSPHTTRMRPSGNTQLLSILNGNKPVATPASGYGLPPLPEVPINTGHR
ncbi:DCP2-domain-containing protein [Hygrophoropsis aurantiaca]|uniref:DCP2-domain-containing protein n=1 Tax=Hygrophoropsis aurantiaca TaxID=72124 RepID=A0ACB8ACW1_9AGAM|nr:DCP2-domain-containing protein [Hygrophoropsis aurantiaca]